MKTTLLAALLVLSLVANGALYWQLVAAGDKPATVSSPSSPTASGSSASVTDTPIEEALAAKTESARVAQIWSGLQGSDLTTLVEKLRAAGFSPAMIRAIVAARIQEQFSARRKALVSQQEEQPYWKVRQRYFTDPKTMSALRDLGREQSNLLKQLLGPDGGSDSEEMLASQRRQFGDLPRSKVDQLQTIISDYGELRGQIYATANGVMLPEDREKLQLLEREQHTDLAALLTPQELENYELRSSSTANNLREQLTLFNPTEDEFRSLFKLQQAFDEKYGSAGTVTSAEQYRQRQTAQKELIDQVKTVLTPDRAETYRQATDPSAQMINRLVTRLELPASAATQVMTVQQDITKRASVVRADKTLAPEVRNMQLTALAQEANTKLTATLGARGLEAYKQFGGQWVQSLVPQKR